jgi:hypothetical protein
MPGNLDPDAPVFADAAAAARDRSAWSAGERAALRRVVARYVAPLIRTRRWFVAAGEFTFVVERARGGGYAVARVPSGCHRLPRQDASFSCPCLVVEMPARASA